MGAGTAAPASPSSRTGRATPRPGTRPRSSRSARRDGREQAAKGHQVSLAPNVNILRTPYGGRAFEGYGEDPYLASQVAAADVTGVQSAGVIATPKHYIGNDQETLRNSIDVQVSQRALAEIYDPAFQAAVRRRRGRRDVLLQPGQRLLRVPELADASWDTLDSVMKFKGFVMSDWGATHTPSRRSTRGST